MKKIIVLISLFGMISTVSAQKANDVNCIYCNNNELGKMSSAIGGNNTSIGMYSLASGYLCTAKGDYSFAFGESCQANGNNNIAIGTSSISDGLGSFSIGIHANSSEIASFSTGSFLLNEGAYSMLFGCGLSPTQKLTNNVDHSLSIGFQSTKPTFFVSSSSGGINSTGKIGIGNITAPEAKLHIKADIDEDASIYLQPTGAGYFAKLFFGDMSHSIIASEGTNMEFNITTGNDFIFNTGNVGIGTTTPAYPLDVAGDIRFTGQLYDASGSFKPGLWETADNGIFFTSGRVGIGTDFPEATLHVAGTLQVDDNIYLNQSDAGLVLKSPDGQCWTARINNSGNWVIEAGDCNTTTGQEQVSEPTVENPVVLFPNPATDLLKIRQIIPGKYFAGILNENGALLMTKELRKKETTIMLSDLPAGIYIVRITDEYNRPVQTQKIVKK